MTVLRRTTIDWDRFLTTFHAQRPGITAAVLTRCRYHDKNPYEWLLDGIDDPTTRILDLACGNAPTRPRLATRWVGIDRSQAELADARNHGARNVVLADALQLPVADRSFDTVVCAMALMLIAPLSDALREISRVLRPGGTLRTLIPTNRPLTWSDHTRFAKFALALHTTPQFPATTLNRHAQHEFTQAGFTITHDEQRRYRYPINTNEDADKFVDSLYLPNLNPTRLQRAHAEARRWHPNEIGIPLRNITATRNTRPT
ncbi:MAG: class I SAM-dependent methyltransferase [Acidimicrobiia bacterium]